MKSVFALVALLAAATPALAVPETVVSCLGELYGRTYYFTGGNVPEDRGGWINDQVSLGRIAITMDEQETMDVRFTDAEGTERSALEEGAVVLPLGATEASVSVLVSYPGKVVEIYTYQAAKNELALNQVKYGTSVNKSTALVGRCSE